MPHSDPSAVRALLGSHASLCHRALTGEHGVALPPLIDHHVHLHLIDSRRLPQGGIAGVVDLGGDPATLARLPRDGMPRVAYAGAFLTPGGGYPSRQGWAPPEIVREITHPSTSPGVAGGAGAAVDEQAEFGASVIKLALNEDAGPVFDDGMLAVLVATAHAHGLPVVAHVQGGDTGRRAIEAGVDALAHTPFTAVLEPELIARAASSQAWISTLDIHRGDASARAIAVANLTAFADAGGRVLYGTDLGNGDLPIGVNARELSALRAAGMTAASILAAMTDPWPALAHADSAGIATFVPGDPPQSDDDLPEWLATAAVVPAEELIHDED
jgi:hypothetical protein